ncbi:hypothetical protein GA0061100_111156 [Rhizobium hainanense]|uniref:Uncharacterized protein n=1 Tax=Rhizobium hainanense TaxID=52131 RepID=A0A1C3W603_9HYPH|nr:hypothetical protein GA0061100_111156 [Rhizobium hainanense]
MLASYDYRSAIIEVCQCKHFGKCCRFGIPCTSYCQETLLAKRHTVSAPIKDCFAGVVGIILR